MTSFCFSKRSETPALPTSSSFNGIWNGGSGFGISSAGDSFGGVVDASSVFLSTNVIPLFSSSLVMGP